MAKKASPTPSVRESIETPVTGTPRSPTTSAPWVARTISWTVKVAIARQAPRARRISRATSRSSKDSTSDPMI